MSEGKANGSRGAWAALGISAILLALLLSSLVYRASLPTDGWTLMTAGGVTALDSNLLGLPSGLRTGDVPLTIEGRSPAALPGGPFQSYLFAPNWQAGAMVTYQVQRGQEVLSVPVRLGHLTARALVDAQRASLGDELSALAYFVIGLFVFARRPTITAAQVLFWLGAVRLTMVLTFLIPTTIVDRLDLIAALSIGFLGYFSWILMLFPTVLLLALVFPYLKRPMRTHPRLTLAALYLPGPVLFVIVFLLNAGAVTYLGVSLLVILQLLTVASAVHSILSSRQDVIARAQIMWVVFGMGVTAVFGLISVVIWVLNPTVATAQPEVWQGALILVLSTALPLTVAFAILRYRLFDIDLIIRRSLIYSALTIILAGLYFGSVVILQQLFRSSTGQDSSVAVVVSTLGIAALFNPLRLGIQNTIDRHFYRRKYDAAQVLAAFGSSVREEVDLQKMTEDLVAVVQETMEPTRVWLWLRPPAAPFKPSMSHGSRAAGEQGR